MQESGKLIFVDTSLMDKNLSNDQRIQIARQLEKSNIDIIQLPDDNPDVAAQIVSQIKDVKVAIACEPLQNKLNDAWEIIKNSAKPRLRLTLSSDLLKDLNLNSPRDKKDVLNVVTESVKYAKTLTEDVELVVVKTKKISKMFLYKIIETAADAGTRTVTIKDQSGKLLPKELDELISDILYNIPEFEDFIIGVSSINKMGLATANSIASIATGAKLVEVSTFNANSSLSNASLKDILTIINTRTDIYKLEVNLNLDELQNTFSLVKELVPC